VAIIKCTALLRVGTGNEELSLASSRLAGWSESWYYEGSIDGARTMWADGSPNWCNLRARLLPTKSWVVGQRYQIVDGQGLPQGGAVVSAGVFPGASGLVCDSPSQSLLVAYYGPDGLNVRRWAMRGLPDARQLSGEYNPSDAWTLALNNLRAFIVTRLLFRAVNHTYVKSNVLQVDGTGLVTTKTDHGLATGQDVFLSRMLDTSTGRSYSTVRVVGTVPTARTFNVAPSLATTIYKGGTARRRGYLFSPVQRTVLERTTVRKVGRPTEEYRGRVSARRR